MLLTRYHPPHCSAVQAPEPSDCLLLRFDQRSRSRFDALTTTRKTSVSVLLPRGLVIRGGALLSNETGDCIEVIAADEPVYRVTASDSHALLRAAYHLGNRHVRLEVQTTFLQLEPDPVLLEMLRQLGGVKVQALDAVFEPEVGAYGGGHHHGHDATFEEDYAVAQAVYQHHHGPNS